MKRTTKFLGSASGLLAIAAFSGLITGASSHAAAATTGVQSAAKTTLVAKAGVKAHQMDDSTAKHDCKGKNNCKGQGGCKTGDNGCKGKNSCKGNGGCKTSGSTHGALIPLVSVRYQGGPAQSAGPLFHVCEGSACPPTASMVSRTSELESGCATPHYHHILSKKPSVDWFEIISENYMCDAGRPLEVLDQILEQYQVIQHGVSMYFGSTDRMDRDQLKRLKSVVKRTEDAVPFGSLVLGECGRDLHA